MPDDFRAFEVSDPSQRAWSVRFLWQQNPISIRHADTVDVKFRLNDGQQEIDRVVALPAPHLRALSAASGRPVTDPWCARLAAPLSVSLEARSIWIA